MRQCISLRLVENSQKLYPPLTVMVDCAEGDKLQAILTQKLEGSLTDAALYDLDMKWLCLLSV